MSQIMQMIPGMSNLMPAGQGRFRAEVIRASGLGRTGEPRQRLQLTPLICKLNPKPQTLLPQTRLKRPPSWSLMPCEAQRKRA